MSSWRNGSSVPAGGVFNTYKVQYSPETHKLLKVMMDEAKLTSLQRKQVSETVKSGQPLPPIRRRPPRPSFVDESLFDDKKNYYFQKRTKDQILYSGAYDREKFVPAHPKVNRSDEKMNLQHIMSYGKGKVASTVKIPKVQSSPKKEQFNSQDRSDELIQEIQDRLQFLDEMVELGEAKKYDRMIKQEIAAKLRELDLINKDTKEEFRHVVPVPVYKPSRLLAWED